MNKYQDALNHLIKCDRDSCSHISDAYRNDISALQELIRKSQQMPTDEKFIEFLRKIRDYCRRRDILCRDCKFAIDDFNDCQIQKLASRLGKNIPADWYMEEIERIIRL